MITGIQFFRWCLEMFLRVQQCLPEKTSSFRSLLYMVLCTLDFIQSECWYQQPIKEQNLGLVLIKDRKLSKISDKIRIKKHNHIFAKSKLILCIKVSIIEDDVKVSFSEILKVNVFSRPLLE